MACRKPASSPAQEDAVVDLHDLDTDQSGGPAAGSSASRAVQLCATDVPQLCASAAPVTAKTTSTRNCMLLRVWLAAAWYVTTNKSWA